MDINREDGRYCAEYKKQMEKVNIGREESECGLCGDEYR